MSDLTAGVSAGLQIFNSAKAAPLRSRLAEFEKYAPVNYSVKSSLTESQKAEKQSEAFTEGALGLQITPSNTNLYESHYQLAKDKAEALFSDETLNHFAKDKRSMMQWAQMVDALNQEIAGYEAYYQDSFGDPSKANGLGNTWADHTLRAKSQGGEQGFWSEQGVEADRTSELNEVMKTVDSRQHTNLKLNLETGQFDYDTLESNVDVFNVNPQTANELFSYSLTQTAFATPSDYAADPKLAKVTGDRTQFDQRLQTEMGKDSFRRAVAQNYINANPDAGLTIDDVMNDEVRFQDAYEDFADQTYEFMESNARQSRRSSGGSGGRSSTPKPSFGDVFNTDLYPGVVNTQAPLKLTVTAINPDTGLPQTGTVKIQNLGVNEDGAFVAIDGRGNEIPVDDTIADQIQKAIGDDEYARIRFELGNIQPSDAPINTSPDGGDDQGEQSWFKSMKDGLGNTRSVNLDPSKAGAAGAALTMVDELTWLQDQAGKTENAKAYRDRYKDNYTFEEFGAGDNIRIIDNNNPDRVLEVGQDESDPKKRQGIANYIFRFMNPQIYDR
jgi:hypothetical protein